MFHTNDVISSENIVPGEENNNYDNNSLLYHIIGGNVKYYKSSETVHLFVQILPMFSIVWKIFFNLESNLWIQISYDYWKLDIQTNYERRIINEEYVNNILELSEDLEQLTKEQYNIFNQTEN